MEYDVASFDEIVDGSMRKIAVAGRDLLLTRVAGKCHIVENGCPHAGGPLDEGVLHGTIVMCPWHKAAFDVTTGRLVEPPAVDDIARFPARVEAGRILVTIDDGLSESSTGTATPEGDQRCFVIVGAGAAGAEAAQTLRKGGFTGRIVLVGEEAELPYDRTVLSKYTVGGTQGGEKTPLQDEAFYERHRIERHIGSVSAIDPGARHITFSDGATLTYDKALLATGGVPRRLGVEGETLDGVFVLRTIADTVAIAPAAAQAKRVVVIGGGFVGMEAAAALCQRGLHVTVVIPQATPFEKPLGPEVGSILRDILEDAGVVFRMRDEVVAIEGTTHADAVRLRGGDVMSADLVLVGLGIVPATDMLPHSVRRDDGAVEVDSRLRVDENLFAAGDIAAFPANGSDERIRVEHWRVAQQQGRAAAMNMLGMDVAFDRVPYFWTSFFSKRLDYVGHAESWDEVVLQRDGENAKFLAFYIRGGGKIAAVAGLDHDKQMAVALNLLSERTDMSIDAFRQAMAAG